MRKYTPAFIIVVICMIGIKIMINHDSAPAEFPTLNPLLKNFQGATLDSIPREMEVDMLERLDEMTGTMLRLEKDSSDCIKIQPAGIRTYEDQYTDVYVDFNPGTDFIGLRMADSNFVKIFPKFHREGQRPANIKLSRIEKISADWDVHPGDVIMRIRYSTSQMRKNINF